MCVCLCVRVAKSFRWHRGGFLCISTVRVLMYSPGNLDCKASNSVSTQQPITRWEYERDREIVHVSEWVCECVFGFSACLSRLYYREYKIFVANKTHPHKLHSIRVKLEWNLMKRSFTHYHTHTHVRAYIYNPHSRDFSWPWMYRTKRPRRFASLNCARLLSRLSLGECS